jgi:hypothetical protein
MINLICFKNTHSNFFFIGKQKNKRGANHFAGHVVK